MGVVIPRCTQAASPTAGHFSRSVGEGRVAATATFPATRQATFSGVGSGASSGQGRPTGRRATILLRPRPTAIAINYPIFRCGRTAIAGRSRRATTTAISRQRSAQTRLRPAVSAGRASTGNCPLLLTRPVGRALRIFAKGPSTQQRRLVAFLQLGRPQVKPDRTPLRTVCQSQVAPLFPKTIQNFHRSNDVVAQLVARRKPHDK